MDNQKKSFPERFFQQVFGFGIRYFATIFLGWAAIPTFGIIIGSYIAIWGQGPTLPLIEYFVDDQGNVDTNYFLISFVVLVLILTVLSTW